MNSRIALTACSDARKQEDRQEIEQLKAILEGYGAGVEESIYLYDDNAGGREKAQELSAYFCDENIIAICDVSGGNVANELLPYLDYEKIGNSSAVFVGYSDLTTIINAIYAKTGKASVLYQARHLVGNAERQREFGEFLRLYEDHLSNGNTTREHNSESYSTTIDYKFIQGESLKGVLVGGNLRCFLKLAGTEYMPDVTDKILLIEALGGDIYSVRSMLSQMKQLKVFDRVKGVVVGTFTALMKQGEYDEMLKLLYSYMPNDMPLVVTEDIGHGSDAKGIWIGEEVVL